MEINEILTGNSNQISDFLGKTYKFECLGCEIATKKIVPPGGIIYEDETFILAIDPVIPINGFLVITVKRHINSITGLSKEEQYKLVEIINKTILILKDLKIAKEITLVQEERSKHFHVWIFPNQDWMIEKFGKGVSYLRDICEYAKQTVSSDDIQEILKTIEKIKIAYKKELIDNYKN